MAIVMGLDQHRAQIAAEWLDTVTGEVARGRIVPADRRGVRRFLARFAGRELEVALEATTGWRFVVEELRRVGARVHLAEAAETSALRGNKQRAKNDRADARHLRELADGRSVAGVLDRAGSHTGSPRAGQVAPHARRRARRVAAADAGRSVSPRAAEARRPAHQQRTARGCNSCRCRLRDASRSRSRSGWSTRSTRG